MAIRDIVTRGFGNGTYDPGVHKLLTRGFSTGFRLMAAGEAGGIHRIPNNMSVNRIPNNMSVHRIPRNDDS